MDKVKGDDNVQKIKKQRVSNGNLSNIFYNLFDLSLPYNNPYMCLPENILDRIAKERSFEFFQEKTENRKLDKANQLFELDKILPDWIYSILEKNVDTFDTLTGTKIYVYASLNEIEIINYNVLNIIDLVKFIRISILLKNNIRNEQILYLELNTCREEILNMFIRKFNISQDLFKFIEKPDIISAIIKDSQNELKLERAISYINRYNYINEHQYSHLIKKLYKIENEKKLIEVCKKDSHPMEKIIDMLAKASNDKNILESIIKLFGIVVPLSYKNNIELYIEENLISYIKVLKRGKLKSISLDVLARMTDRKIRNRISCLKDDELFNYLGIYVPYKSRDQLINNFISVIKGKSFIYPIERSKKRSLNETTILYTDVENKNIFLICYGNLLKYYTYELEELIFSFNMDFKERGVVTFKHPENSSLVFSKEEIEHLMTLLNSFPPSNDITKLLEIIKEGLIELNEQSIYDKDILLEFVTLSKLQKEDVNNFLKKIIDVGMYMRKWRGPGYPYPLSEKDTLKGDDTKENVSSHIGDCLELLNNMNSFTKSFCMNLKMSRYDKSGVLENSQRTFDFIWNSVIKGDACIRMASSEFIGTGIHYLRIFFRENIPGVDIKNLDRIN